MSWTYLYNDIEDTKTRFVSFVGNVGRHDLAITITGRFYGKMLVMNLQSSRFAIIGPDDLETENYLETTYQLGTDEAEELRQFLYTLL